jgi:hypothetical protein
VTSEAEVGSENVQEHEHDDDQDDDGKNSAASAAATRFDYGRVFAFSAVAIIVGHETLPLFPCCVGETNELPMRRFRQ